jgi:uncharacterized membrane protein YidH (DUF202 family)
MEPLPSNQFSIDQQTTYDSRAPILGLSNDEAEVNESTFLLAGFPYSLVLDITSSEPRDVLQSERTCLTFVRFSTTLFFGALGIILNFRIDSSGDSTPDNHKSFHTITSTVISYILLVFAVAILLIAGYDYIRTVKRYASHHIITHGFNDAITIVCMTGVVVSLFAINILLLVEGYVS